MSRRPLPFAATLALAWNLMRVTAFADTTIASFQNFTSDALYGSWANASIDSGPTSYQITASGYGSNWKYLPLSAAPYETNVELTVTLSGGGSGFLGPIITLVDSAGREYSFAWYGQTLGSHLLTMPIDAPSSTNGPTGPLDTAHLNGIHMQLDPGTYSGSYTVSWQNLRLVGQSPPLRITSQSYDPGTQNFTLTWSSFPGLTYTIFYTPDLSVAMMPLATSILSGGTSTTNTVVLPTAQAGFLRIQLE